MANQRPKAESKILIAGFGAIGQRMCSLAPSASIISLNRASSSIAPLHYCADLLKPETLQNLPSFDYVIITATPDERTEPAYQKTYVEATKNLLAAIKDRAIRRVFFVSSTSVYGQSEGEIVDEASPTKPQRFSGKSILKAEQLLAANQTPSTCVRFGGIYGEHRTMLIRHVQQGIDVPSGPAILTNRIHEADCAGFLLHLVALDEKGVSLAPCYIAVDDNGADKKAVYQFIAAQLGEANKLNLIAKPASNLGKRCQNKLMSATGYQLIYPDYQVGYKAIIDTLK